MRFLFRTIGLLALVALGAAVYSVCNLGKINPFSAPKASAEDSRFPADYQSLSAEQKLQFIWSELIVTSLVSNPPLLAANPSLPFFNMAKTMDTEADELPEFRPKAIHRSGAVAKVKFIAEANTPLTGLWKGSDFGLVRLSLATKDAENKITIPGSAFKMFVNGSPSMNFVAMHDLDGGTDFNFFGKEFSNVVAQPKSTILQFIGKAFARTSLFPTGVYLQNIASVNEDGSHESKPVFPYRIFLSPNPEFAKFSSTVHDFRSDLATIPPKNLLYTVYAVIPENPNDDDAANMFSSVSAEEYRSKAVKVGRFVTDSNFVVSEWADSRLFFQHQRYANKKPN